MINGDRLVGSLLSKTVVGLHVMENIKIDG